MREYVLIEAFWEDCVSSISSLNNTCLIRYIELLKAEIRYLKSRAVAYSVESK